MENASAAGRPVRLIWVVWFISAAVLGFEISLMRMLLVASWHHFAFLVISVVLLGFGASGTALFLLRSWVVPRGETVLFVLALATAGAVPICSAIAQHVPIEARFLPALLWQQVGYWMLYWAVLTIPFFLGAAAIGLSLMLAGERVGTVYGANLIGSAAGALLAPVLMSIVPAAWLPLAMGGLALLGAAGVRPASATKRMVAITTCAALVVGCVWLDPPHVRVDPYKDQAYMQRLMDQGSVQRIGRAIGPRAVVEAYRGDVLHDLPFLGVGALPPPMSVILADGHKVGSVLDVDRAARAEVMDQTLTAIPYALVAREPRVALLGETGGTNIWLAARHRASSIHVVQPDENLVDLLRGPLQEYGGTVWDLPGVRSHVAEPRHFIEHTTAKFDLIQLVTLQTLAAGSGGMGGLAQDHLITVQGITACLRQLRADGLLAVTRGIQTPPRDNLKLLATFVEALRRIEIESPAKHIVIVRDYLAVCTMVKVSPWQPHEIDQVRALCRDRQLTPVWFDGVQSQELNQPDALPQPPDGIGDWYHFAARQLFSSDADRFITEWAFDIRPPTDDRPFFLDFSKLASIGAQRDAYGALWLTRAELAFLFVLAATLIIGIVSAVATVIPLPLLPADTGGRRGGRAATVIYFSCLGLGYLLLEIVCLSHLTYLIGDPVRAAAVTICGFLLFSGLGSMTTQRIRHDRARALRRIIIVLVALGIGEMIALRQLAPAAGSLPVLGRCAVGLIMIAPLGYVMGFPMPMGLGRLSRAAPGLIPWAWGTNGFASVLAAPLATVLAMCWGYSIAAGLALLLYLLAALAFSHLPSCPPIAQMRSADPPASG
ncbi:MAG: hypothetical protein IH830_11360 [Planctomycetes bacterium]|nr:hypothetical protein [Planctomycetota bacterium]